MRARGLVLAGLLLAGVLGLVASAQPWWRVSGGGAAVAFSGTEATGGLSQALSAVLLAGLLLVLVLHTRGRRILGVVLALVGLAVALVGALRLRPSEAAFRTRLRQVSLIDQFGVSPTTWPWVFAVAGVLAAGVALTMVRTAPRWPRRIDRFDRSVTPLPRSSDGPALAEDPAAAWKAMDAGLDPTLDRDPVVQNGAVRDTMGEQAPADEATAPPQPTDHPTRPSQRSPE